MTQEVQPLAWQKRTNLEEHQQFFSKINEIIANLAPTVDEAEAAIAQATQAIASANAAIATANAASANADAASQQAQTAANTVAGYNTRLIAVEDESSGNTANIIDLQDRMGTAESKNAQQDTAISALQTADAQNVKLTGAQNITGIKTVPTEATGTRSQQIANSAKVGAELDNYAPMVRTTGNQTKTGILTSVTEGGFNVTRNTDYSIAFVQQNTGIQRSDAAAIRRFIPLWIVDAGGEQMFSLRYEKIGKTHKVYVRVVDSAGTQHDQTILQFTEA